MFLKRLEHHYRSLVTFVVAVGISLLLSLSSLAPSRAIPVSEVSDPRQDNHWVMDRADILSPEAEAQMNRMISGLVTQRGTEMLVVTVPDIKPLTSPEEYAFELLNTWESDDQSLSDCVLLLVSQDGPHAVIERGEGVKTINLSMGKINDIITTQMYPAFAQGSFELGIVNGTQAVNQVLEREDPSEIYTLPPDVPIPVYILMAIIMGMAWFFLALGLLGIAIVVVVMTPAVVLMSVFRKNQLLQISPGGRTTLPTPGSRLWLIRTLMQQWLIKVHESVTPEQATPIATGMYFTHPLIQSWWIFFFLYSVVGGMFPSVNQGQMIQGHEFVLCWLGVWFGYELWCCVNYKGERVRVLKRFFKGLFFSTFIALSFVVIVANVFKVPVFEAEFIRYSLTAFGGAWAGTLLLLRSLVR